MADYINIDDLEAFSIVANSQSLRQAAERLHISQPPLSRKISNLETRLGVKLFIRHHYGLELTPEGRKALEIIQPFLESRESMQAKLDMLAKTRLHAIGLSTAFEQSVYEPVIKFAKSIFREQIELIRAPSPHLANEVAKGNIMAALVALPLQKSGLTILDLRYRESLLAVMPQQWENMADSINLAELNDRPFFWFSARRNPYWHAHMKEVFNKAGFKAKILEEPMEHDVLLGRIANGEAFALMPKSFSAIQRKGIKYVKVRDLPPLAMGIAYNGSEGELFAQNFAKNNLLPRNPA